jgi:hypothetical protein
MFHVLGNWQWPALHVFALVLSLLLLLPFVYFLPRVAVAHDRRADVHFYAITLAAGTLGILAFQGLTLAGIYASITLLVGSIFLAAGCGFFVRELKNLLLSDG